MPVAFPSQDMPALAGGFGGGCAGCFTFAGAAACGATALDLQRHLFHPWPALPGASESSAWQIRRQPHVKFGISHRCRPRLAGKDIMPERMPFLDSPSPIPTVCFNIGDEHLRCDHHDLCKRLSQQSV